MSYVNRGSTIVDVRVLFGLGGVSDAAVDESCGGSENRVSAMRCGRGMMASERTVTKARRVTRRKSSILRCMSLRDCKEGQ